MSHPLTSSLHVVVAALSFGVLVSPTAAAQESAYRFTTERDLGNSDYRDEIENFWRTGKSRMHTWEAERSKEEDAFFKGEGGLKISFVSFRLPRDKEQGAIVISSGRTESYAKYKELVFDLVNNGYSVYIHDHRGQGFSDREPEIQAGCKAGEPDGSAGKSTRECQRGYVRRFDYFVDDLETFMAEIVSKGGHEHVFLLAHSMGGAIASRYLELRPAASRNTLRAVAMTSPMHGILGVRRLPARILSCRVVSVTARILDPTGYVLMQTGYAPKDFKENEFTQSEVRYQRLGEEYGKVSQIKLGGITRRWLNEACSAADKAVEHAPAITVPVLLYQAGDDTIVDPRGHRAFCRLLRLGKANAEQGCGAEDGGPIVVHNARHELLIEVDDHRTKVLRGILRFFDTHRQASAGPDKKGKIQ